MLWRYKYFAILKSLDISPTLYFAREIAVSKRSKIPLFHILLKFLASYDITNHFFYPFYLSVSILQKVDYKYVEFTKLSNFTIKLRIIYDKASEVFYKCEIPFTVTYYI